MLYKQPCVCPHHHSIRGEWMLCGSLPSHDLGVLFPLTAEQEAKLAKAPAAVKALGFSRHASSGSFVRSGTSTSLSRAATSWSVGDASNPISFVRGRSPARQVRPGTIEGTRSLTPADVSRPASSFGIFRPATSGKAFVPQALAEPSRLPTAPFASAASSIAGLFTPGGSSSSVTSIASNVQTVVVNLERQSEEQRFGFHLGFLSDGTKYISSITPGTVADSQGRTDSTSCLQSLDILIRVNGLDAKELSKNELVGMIARDLSLKLVVLRAPPESPWRKRVRRPKTTSENSDASFPSEGSGRKRFGLSFFRSRRNREQRTEESLQHAPTLPEESEVCMDLPGIPEDVMRPTLPLKLANKAARSVGATAHTGSIQEDGTSPLGSEDLRLYESICGDAHDQEKRSTSDSEKIEEFAERFLNELDAPPT